MRGLSQALYLTLLISLSTLPQLPKLQQKAYIPYKTDSDLFNLTLRSKSSIIIQKFLFTADVLTSVDPACLWQTQQDLMSP